VDAVQENRLGQLTAALRLSSAVSPTRMTRSVTRHTTPRAIITRAARRATEDSNIATLIFRVAVNYI
jgi:hypothetical protein